MSKISMKNREDETQIDRKKERRKWNKGDRKEAKMTKYVRVTKRER